MVDLHGELVWASYTYVAATSLNVDAAIPGGEMIAAMMKATGWQQHSVRGLSHFAGLRTLVAGRRNNRGSDRKIYPDASLVRVQSEIPAPGKQLCEPAWKTKPSWYLITTEDRMIPPPAQQFMSRRAGSTVVDVKGSHAIYVSQRSASAPDPASLCRSFQRPQNPQVVEQRCPRTELSFDRATEDSAGFD
jgi:predicted RNA binding protein YcfA (HicA-like mRNA interferase family)